MKIVNEVDLGTVETHLKSVGSALGFKGMPGTLGDYQFFKVVLEERDISNLVLWWEFQNDTRGNTCWLTDAMDSAASDQRVRNFIDGHPAMNVGPVDLRTAQGLEPVAVTNRLNGTIHYLIDGNHRVLAQHFSQKGFEGVSMYVCVHPLMLNWGYIPNFHKKLPLHQQ